MFKISFVLKPTCDTQYSIRDEKLKANRASDSEEQRKEWLRIRRKNYRARKRTKKLQEEKKRSSETEDYEKLCLANLYKLKQVDENELERKLRLEKVVASKQLRFACRCKKKEEQDWRMMQLPNGPVWSWRCKKKEKEDLRRW